MSLSISWRLGSSPGPLAGGEPADFAAWVQVAQAAEYAGLNGLFISCAAGQPESFTLAAALCAHTRRLALTTSFPSEVMLPAALAAAAQSLQSISQNRLQLHLPDSEHSAVRQAFGDLLNRDQRNERIGEYLRILTHLLQPGGAPLDVAGHYFQLENAVLPSGVPLPLLLDESQSPALIATYADQCLLHAQHPHRLAATIARLQALASAQQRSLRFATVLGLIMRDDAAQAWTAADAWLLQQRHCLALPNGYGDAGVVDLSQSAARRYEFYPNLWRPSAQLPPMLVGSTEQVAGRLEELYRLGISQVIVEAVPAVREILRVGEELLPRLHARGVTTQVHAHGQ
ncbi:LLM class flavin-dependent oxidoreductase [Pseudomonas sp. TE3786]